jgi:two-component system chemotaxis response regulator CheY
LISDLHPQERLVPRVLSAFQPQGLCLVADGSAAIRNAAQSILRDLHFQTIEAGTGFEAFIKCRKYSPSAILLDDAMPHLNGLEFLQMLQEHHIWPTPKIIFCTRERAPMQIARAMDAGADEYMIKPFDRSILVAKMENLGLRPRFDKFNSSAGKHATARPSQYVQKKMRGKPAWRLNA